MKGIIIFVILLCMTSCSIQKDYVSLSFDEKMQYMANIFLKKTGINGNGTPVIFEINHVDSVYSYTWKKVSKFRNELVKDIFFSEISKVSFIHIKEGSPLCESSLPNKYYIKGSVIFIWENHEVDDTLPQTIIQILNEKELIFNLDNLLEHISIDDNEKIFSIFYKKDNPTIYKIQNSNMNTIPKF